VPESALELHVKPWATAAGCEVHADPAPRLLPGDGWVRALPLHARGFSGLERDATLERAAPKQGATDIWRGRPRVQAAARGGRPAGGSPGSRARATV